MMMTTSGRISHNTVLLYIRMAVVMLVSIYTVRIVLNQLGVVDYGIYNLIVGVVAVFSFPYSTFVTSSQRFFSVGLGKNDLVEINKWFCQIESILILFLLCLIVLAETVGLWLLNTQISIPDGRITEANVVFQLLMVSFSLRIAAVPYYSLLIAHERVGFYAFLSMVEAVLKFGAALLLSIVHSDKLVLYAILMSGITVLSTSAYFIYGHKYFPESRFGLFLKIREAHKLLKFTGWHMFGALSNVMKLHGVNIVISFFFSPAVNAARAIAYQVDTAMWQLAESVLTAVRPEMGKCVGRGDISSLNQWTLRCMVSYVFLISMMVLPIMVNTDFILGLWLKEVPVYAVAFTQLLLINRLIEAISEAATCATEATGVINRFYLYVGMLNFMNIPLSFLVLKSGYDALATMVISISISFVVLFVKAYLLTAHTKISLKKYFGTISRMLFSTFIIGGMLSLICHLSENGWLIVGETILFSILAHILLYATIVAEKDDRLAMIDMLKTKVYMCRR